MSITIVIIGFAIMLALMFLSLPVAVAIVAVGALGGMAFYGFPLVDMMGGVLWTSLNSPAILAIPLTLLVRAVLVDSDPRARTWRPALGDLEHTRQLMKADYQARKTERKEAKHPTAPPPAAPDA